MYTSTRNYRLVVIRFTVLAAVASSALALARGEGRDAYRPAWVPPLSATYARLAALPSVQRELKLTADQEAKIDAVVDKMKAVNKRKPTWRERLVQPDGKKKLDEYVKDWDAVTEEMKETLDATLEPEQMSRLKGLVLQMVGPGAMSYKEIQRDLALSDDQLARIKAINVDRPKALRQRLDRSRDSTTPKSRVSPRDYREQITNVLTEDQRALFTKMQGAKFAMPPQEMRELYSW